MKALRRHRGERGAAAVEFAILAPLLFLLLFGIIDFGLGLSADVNINNAAREGARLAAIDPTSANIVTAVRTAAKDLNQTALTVTIACVKATGGACPGGLPGGKQGDAAIVTVVYAYKTITPIGQLIGSSMVFTATSQMRIE